jgi:DNA repair ATPase RecN
LKELDDAQLIALRDSYEVAVRQREAIKELKRTLQEAANNIEARSEAFNVRAEASVFKGASPLSSFSEVAAETLSQLGGHLASFVDRHRDRLLAAAKDLEDKSAHLDQAFDEFAKTYTSSVRELQPDKQRLLESYRQVMEDTKALPRLHAEMATEKAEIDARLADLVAVCNGVADALDAQTSLREEKVSELNAQLEVFGVRLQVCTWTSSRIWSGRPIPTWVLTA